jgi:kynurenine formamidase
MSLKALRAALQKQNIQEADIKEGDAVFFNTGFGKLWIKNNGKFDSGEPGIGLEVAKWCIDKGVCMTGAGTWATEVVPNPNKELAFPLRPLRGTSRVRRGGRDEHVAMRNRVLTTARRRETISR